MKNQLINNAKLAVAEARFENISNSNKAISNLNKPLNEIEPMENDCYLNMIDAVKTLLKN